tara:strand:+ start:7675 stop:8460 length:786 start_codon:yes stop_codon:yes gene_type:complete
MVRLTRIEHIFENNIEKKHCGKCKTFVNISNFNRGKTWDLLRNTCKTCLHEERMKNRPKMREYNKKYWERTKEEQTARSKIWRENNKDYIKEKNKQYYEENWKELNKKDYQRRKKKLQNDPEYKEKCAAWRRDYEKNERLTNPQYKIKTNISRRIRELLQEKGGKNFHTNEYIGCSIYDLRCHLEKQFDEYMNWDNYGKWHIDHIIPCNSFDLKDEFQQKACFHYTNLQPMWAKENIQKRDHYNTAEKEEYMKNFRELYLV